MKPENRHFTSAFLVCFALVATCLCVWQGARFGFVLPAYAMVCGVVAIVYRQCAWRSLPGAYVLLAMTTLSTCGAIINVNYFTTVFSSGLDSPVLFNWDASTDWYRAMYCLGLTNDPGSFSSRHLAHIAAALMRVFGTDITVPIMFNVLCYPLALIVMGSVAFTLTSSRKVALATLVAGSLMCYFYTQSTWLIKDVPVTLCVGTCALVLARWRSRTDAAKVSDVVLLAVAMAALLFLRANFMYVIALGAAMMAVRRGPWRLDWRMVAVAVVAVALRWGYDMVYDSVSAQALLTVDGHTTLNHVKPPTRAWDNMHGKSYEDLAVWQRLLFLPASVLVQFLIPFPWNFTRDTIFGPTMFVAHFGFFWYYAGALIVYWLFGAWRGGTPTMRLVVVWGIVMTVMTAWMSAGRVSRYCLPYLPLLLPAAGYVAVNLWRRRSLWIWLGVFTALLVPTLIVCHHLQMTAS